MLFQCNLTTINLIIFYRKSRKTLILLFKHLQVQIIRGQLSGNKNIIIPRFHFKLYILNVIVFSIFNFIKTGIGP